MDCPEIIGTPYSRFLPAMTMLQLFSLLKSKLFRICFVVFTIVFFIIGGSANSFTYFKIWTLKQNLKLGTEYTQENLVDDAAMGTVIAQLYQSSTFYSNDSLISRWLKLFHDTQALVSVNIADLIKDSKDPGRTIDLHNAHISKKLDELEIIVGQLREMATKKQEASNICLNRKKIGDQTFLQGVSENNPKLVQEGMDGSTADAPCYITNRIQANAYIYLAERIQGYKVALTTRKSLLETNRQAIIKYGNQLDSTMDKELSTLKVKMAQLRSYEMNIYQQVWSSTATAGSLEDLQSFFNYGFPTDTNTIPRLKFRFNDNNTNVPSFKDGAFKNISAWEVKDGRNVITTTSELVDTDIIVNWLDKSEIKE